MAVEVVTASPEETEALAAGLARTLSVGDIVAVSGELGAGKTTFVRGALRALGVTGPITSPTFVVGHLYDGPYAHLDLYRLAGMDAEDPGLLDDVWDRYSGALEPLRASGRLGTLVFGECLRDDVSGGSEQQSRHQPVVAMCHLELVSFRTGVE